MKQILTILLLAPLADLHAAEPAAVEFNVKLETVMKHDDEKFLWFHPRAGAIPGAKLGNFGVTEVNEHETWVTDSEWMQINPPNYADFTQCTKDGSDNAVFAARMHWKKPNTTWNQR